MPAYVLSEVEARDPEAFEQYRSRAAASIARHGGRYLVRGGPVELVEGGPRPAAIVIVEFSDMAAVRRWYASPDYAAALAYRDRALVRRLLFVEGVAPVEGLLASSAETP